MTASPSPLSRKKGGGFTLIEMLVTLSVFILLTGAVFEIISTVLRGSSDLQDSQNRREQITALNTYLTAKFQKMPARSFLRAYQRGDSGGLDLNGIAFGGYAGITVIDAVPQPNGLYTLRYGFISLTPPFPTSGGFSFVTLPDALLLKDDPDFGWTPLIRDLKTVSWRFLDLNQTTWQTTYPNPSSKPNLVEFTIQLAGDPLPTVMDFWIPHLQSVNVRTAAQTQ